MFYLWRYAGIPVYADLSLVLMAGFIILSDFGHALDNVIFTSLLFASIVAHEFGHSLTALRFRYHVEMIVLNILGGAALIGSTPRKASHEFLIAIAGPAVSVAVGLVGILVYPYIYDIGMPGIAALVREVARTNFGLAIFNLMPAFPLDGGRVFRSILTPRLGLLKATEVAANVGRCFAIFAGAYSVLRILADAGMFPDFAPIHILGFYFGGGILMLAVSVFIYIAAQREYENVIHEHYSSAFRWSNTEWREGDGESWKRNERNISDQGDVSPPPFERNRYKGIRGFFRRLFRK